MNYISNYKLFSQRDLHKSNRVGSLCLDGSFICLLLNFSLSYEISHPFYLLVGGIDKLRVLIKKIKKLMKLITNLINLIKKIN